ncbi:DUF302 domain-containing protein [Fulvivirga kasyanovii]|uniref:DUF302 domain-containing protein n=1 Tax=Fulvivirga kasyanovii TaxID=396812 RepID=A0ABW9RYP7_9BACT|nr:DUF302 domain-containing protein [Fulvivirga kasyanovii]MTI28399.1 DUF302 domain-containing protein [Fulvivirga kasyanovii]
MEYYHSKLINDAEFEEVIDRVVKELKKEGFGILTEVDVQETMKNKLNIEFNPYKILGACNPEYAYKALKAEDKIGTMLPCNVIVQDLMEGHIEVSIVDPISSMQAVSNEDLEMVALNIRTKLLEVLKNV